MSECFPGLLLVLMVWFAVVEEEEARVRLEIDGIEQDSAGRSVDFSAVFEGPVERPASRARRSHHRNIMSTFIIKHKARHRSKPEPASEKKMVGQQPQPNRTKEDQQKLVSSSLAELTVAINAAAKRQKLLPTSRLDGNTDNLANSTSPTNTDKSDDNEQFEISRIIMGMDVDSKTKKVGDDSQNSLIGGSIPIKGRTISLTGKITLNLDDYDDDDEDDYNDDSGATHRKHLRPDKHKHNHTTHDTKGVAKEILLSLWNSVMKSGKTKSKPQKTSNRTETPKVPEKTELDNELTQNVLPVLKGIMAKDRALQHVHKSKDAQFDHKSKISIQVARKGSKKGGDSNSDDVAENLGHILEALKGNGFIPVKPEKQGNRVKKIYKEAQDPDNSQKEDPIAENIMHILEALKANHTEEEEPAHVKFTKHWASPDEEVYEMVDYLKATVEKPEGELKVESINKGPNLYNVNGNALDTKNLNSEKDSSRSSEVTSNLKEVAEFEFEQVKTEVVRRSTRNSAKNAPKDKRSVQIYGVLLAQTKSAPKADGLTRKQSRHRRDLHRIHNIIRKLQDRRDKLSMRIKQHRLSELRKKLGQKLQEQRLQKLLKPTITQKVEIKSGDEDEVIEKVNYLEGPRRDGSNVIEHEKITVTGNDDVVSVLDDVVSDSGVIQHREYFDKPDGARDFVKKNSIDEDWVEPEEVIVENKEYDNYEPTETIIEQDFYDPAGRKTIITENYSGTPRKKSVEEDLYDMIKENNSLTPRKMLVEEDFYDPAGRKSTITENYSLTPRKKIIEEDFISDGTSSKTVIKENYSLPPRQKVIKENYLSDPRKTTITENYSLTPRKKIIEEDFISDGTFSETVFKEKLSHPPRRKVIKKQYLSDPRKVVIKEKYQHNPTETMIKESYPKTLVIKGGLDNRPRKFVFKKGSRFGERKLVIKEKNPSVDQKLMIKKKKKKKHYPRKVVIQESYPFGPFKPQKITKKTKTNGGFGPRKVAFEGRPLVPEFIDFSHMLKKKKKDKPLLLNLSLTKEMIEGLNVMNKKNMREDNEGLNTVRIIASSQDKSTKPPISAPSPVPAPEAAGPPGPPGPPPPPG